MPPKDDDDPASTKEVVTKKQKQLLNREELNLAAIAEAFGGLLLEAPAKKGSNLPFKDPEPDPVSRKDAEALQRMTRTSGSAAERIQRGLESQEKLTRKRRTRSSADPSQRYPRNPDTGKFERKSIENYGQRLLSRGYGDPDYDPVKRGGMSPDAAAKSVRRTMSLAAKGDKSAQKTVQGWEDALEKKYPQRRPGQTTRTRTSASSAATSGYESDLRKGVTDPSGSPRPDDRSPGRKSVKDLLKDVLKDRRAAAVSRGGRGGSGGERSRTTRRARPNPKPTAQTGVGFDPRTSARKDTAAAIAAQNTPEVRRTPKVGGPEGGYRAPAQPTPGNVASQPKTDPLAITKYRAKATPSGTKIPSFSGGDAGAAVRRAVQARTDDAGAKARRALQTRTPKPVVKPSVPRRVGGTLARGAIGTGIGLGVGAGIEKLPVNRQTKDALQLGATGIGAALTPVASTLLSIGGSTRRGETTKPSASDTATAFKSDSNKVSVSSGKPAYDPRNPYDITKWRLSTGPNVTTKMTKAELDKLTKPKFADLRGSIRPGSVIPKGFVSTDPELAAQTERERQLSTGTATATTVATAPAGETAPPVVKAPPKTTDPKDPKDPPIKKGPITIPVVPPTTGVPGPTRGPGGKKTKNNKFKFGVPQQPRGKIGRRQNPQ